MFISTRIPLRERTTESHNAWRQRDLEQIPLMLHRSRRDGGMRRIPAL